MLQTAGALADFIASSVVRKSLLAHLTEGPRTPTELALLEKKHVSHVSRALRELKLKGVVEPMHGQSRETYYKLTKQGYLASAALSKLK